MPEIRPIRTPDHHAAALAEIASFDDAVYDSGTPASDRLDVLITLVELADLLGSASRASEVLNRRRPLTLDMIRIISDAWKIPRDALTDAYALADVSARGRGRRKRRPVSDAA